MAPTPPPSRMTRSGRARPRPGRRHRRHRRPAPHQGNLMDELAKCAASSPAGWTGTARDAPRCRRDDGTERTSQARLFAEAAGVTGIALTKLDGSAKGGVAIAIAHELGIPVKLVGVGEGVDDLRPFDAHDYAARSSRSTSRPTVRGIARHPPPGVLRPSRQHWVEGEKEDRALWPSRSSRGTRGSARRSTTRSLPRSTSTPTHRSARSCTS